MFWFAPFRRWFAAVSAIGVLLSSAGCSLVAAPAVDTPAAVIVPVLTSATASNTSPIPVAITWSEAVTGFSLDHLYIENGTAQNLAGSGADYTFEIIPDAEGEVILVFPFGAARGADGTATYMTGFVIAFDSTGPSVTIDRSVSQDEFTDTLPVEFTATFDEAIDTSTFTAADITQDGTAGGVTWTITDTGDHMTFTVKATAISGAPGTLIPSIAVGLVEDPSGNTSSISTTNGDIATYLPYYANLTLWLRADDLSLGNGDSVTTWADKSSNANDAAEVTNPPTFLTNAQNSLPVVHFAGGNQILRTVDNSGVSGNPDMTIFLVTQVNGFGPNYPAFLQFGEGSADGLSAWVALDGNTTNFYTGFYNGGNASNVGTPGAGYNLYTWVRDSAGGTNNSQTGNTQYWNGVAAATSPALSTVAVNITNGVVRIGRGTVDVSIQADIAEILIYGGTAMAPAVRTKVEDYLNAKWDLY